MSEQERKQEEEPKVEPGADPKNTENSESPGPIPYERFKAVNEKARGYEARLAQLEQENADREAAAELERTNKLKEQAKFESLAQELERKYAELKPRFDSADAELQKTTAILEKYAEVQVAQVPELYRGIIGKLPLTERLEWLTENQDKITKVQPKGIPATPEGSGRGELSDDERRRKSARTF